MRAEQVIRRAYVSAEVQRDQHAEADRLARESARKTRGRKLWKTYPTSWFHLANPLRDWDPNLLTIQVQAATRVTEMTAVQLGEERSDGYHQANRIKAQ
ncbi:hypothetical protein CYMTET_6388 [Cymbomonas tetramitiformis]|uniref:Uncharacterized protein n=1 Tax=Cymbomonas tetramitiformis TaxID=36881 RepID=A0AAE0GX67_9CHLO|nr:hypothetical protein CYMTET_6388 [Cymbomonas tetramitiformis]